MIHAPTIFGIKIGDRPACYYFVLASMLFLLEAHRAACDPSILTYDDQSVDLKKAKEVAFHFIDRENKIKLATQEAYKANPNRLTYLRVLEADLFTLISATENVFLDGDFEEISKIVDEEAEKHFDFFGTTSIIEWTTYRSKCEEQNAAHLRIDNDEWNEEYNEYNKRKSIMQEIREKTKTKVVCEQAKREK